MLHALARAVDNQSKDSQELKHAITHNMSFYNGWNSKKWIVPGKLQLVLCSIHVPNPHSVLYISLQCRFHTVENCMSTTVLLIRGVETMCTECEAFPGIGGGLRATPLN